MISLDSASPLYNSYISTSYWFVSCVCISQSVVSDSLRPMDYSLPDSSVHGILQARILEWVAISFSRRSSPPRSWTRVSCIAGRFFTIGAILLLNRNSVKANHLSFSCVCFSRSVVSDSLWPHGLYSLPSSSVHGILQARILEWVAISFSWGSTPPRDRTWVSHIAGRFFTVWATY